jgi:multidrug resistance efflux pump
MKRLNMLILCLGFGAALAFGAVGGRSASPPVKIALSSTGTIIAPQQLALAFGAAGRLTALEVHSGEKVSAGQLLARLDPTSAEAAVQTAAANLASARAQLLDLENGLPGPERRQLRVTLVQSRNSLSSANTALADTVGAARADAVQLSAAVTQAQRQLASDRGGLDADQALQASDEATLRSDQAALKTIADRLVSERSVHVVDAAHLLADQRAQADDAAASAAPSVLADDAKAILNDEATIAADESAVAEDESNLGDAHVAVSGDEGHVSADRQTITSDGARIVADESALTNARNAQRRGRAAARQSIDTARSARSAALLAVTATASENAVHLEAPRVGQIAAARAAIAVARADLTTSNQALRDTRLLAPFPGTITSVDAVIGQLVPPSGPGLLTLANLATLAVTTRFSPAEAGLLRVGQEATVTLAAPAGVTLVGHVRAIGTAGGATPSSSASGPTNDPTASPANAPSATSDTVIVALDHHAASLRPGMQVGVAVTVTGEVARLRPAPSGRG